MLEFIKPWNPILAADGYKATHYKQLPKDKHTTRTYSVVVPRKPSQYSTQIVAMGQTFVASMLASIRIQEWMIDEAEVEITEQGYEFNRAGWEIISRDLNGRLPLAVYGVEEGRIVDPQTPIIGIFNTDERFAWLPAYFETIIQQVIWKMSTVASLCKSIRTTLAEYIELTGADRSALNYSLINFGDRGADSPEEAPVIAGIAHAALFDGSDCLRANGYIKKLYNTSKSYTSSVDAYEHSTICANSNAETKDDWNAALAAIDILYAAVERSNKGIGIPVVSVVIDTYNSRRFVKDYIGTKLKDQVINSKGKLVLRPDSGDITVEPSLVAADIESTFGVTTNSKGYKVLPPYIGVIQGDGLRIDTYKSVLDGWVNAGYSMDNFLLGMGSGITHDSARDDFSFSMKAIATEHNNRWYPLLKEPITDIGKKSLSGLVRCAEDENGDLYVYDANATQQLFSFYDSTPGWRLWFKNGFREYRQSFDEVRKNARA
jgi:nicotinamide phosphoribosyltransferase